MAQFRSRRVTDPDELIALYEPGEPATTHALGAVRDRRLHHGQNAWIVEGPNGVGAALLIDRLCFDRWLAWPTLFDPDAAPAVASLVDDSRACLLEGPPGDVIPCIPHLSRRHREPEFSDVLQGSVIVDSASPEAVDPRSRVANGADLDRLVDFYRGWEIGIIPTVPRLRRYLRGRIEHGPVVMLERRGEIVAAAYVGTRTDRFLLWTGLLALQEHRGRGIGAALFPLAALITKQEGCQALAVWSPTNEIRRKPRRVERMVGDYEIGEWATVDLGLPRKRFRGESRARRLLERLEGRVRPRPAS